ncbi:serine hydrolase [Escherichia coli]|uniref:serine hydrolase n=1 Tax=Escherichia coli TaxID=562 RepID=UPI0033163F28
MIREAAGQPFEEFMAARVLRPAGMTSSSFAQALPPELAARAASGTGPDGAVTPGKWHVQESLMPTRFRRQLAPAGFVSSPGPNAESVNLWRWRCRCSVCASWRSMSASSPSATANSPPALPLSTLLSIRPSSPTTCRTESPSSTGTMLGWLSATVVFASSTKRRTNC